MRVAAAAPLLSVRGLAKRFGGVAALDGVDLDIAAGEIHGLVGENGAGKSTLIGCLTGVHRADRGRMDWEGAAFAPEDPQEALRAGIAAVHQELNVVPGFSAAETLCLGRRYPRRMGLIDRRAMRDAARELAGRLAPGLPLDAPMARLSAGQRQMVEILRALARDARLLILDEPTASLSQGEADRLHALIRDLAAGGTAVLYVSHRLGDVLSTCARVCVLRGGRTVATGAAAELSPPALVRHMTGAAATTPRRARASPGEVVLEVDALPFGPEGTPLSLRVRAGEILALYGLVGAGRSGLLRCVWGAAEARVPGRIRLRGEPLSGGIRGRIRRGVAYVPEERRADGFVMHHGVVANAVLPHLPRFRAQRRLPMPSRARSRAFLEAVRRRFDLRLGSPDAPVASLSGGNQQKVLVGRWTAAPMALLLLDEPTRGVDVGAKGRLHDDLRRLAREEGVAILAATSDLEEALELADRIAVMARGRVTAAMPAEEADARRILAAAFVEPERARG